MRDYHKVIEVCRFSRVLLPVCATLAQGGSSGNESERTREMNWRGKKDCQKTRKVSEAEEGTDDGGGYLNCRCLGSVERTRRSFRAKDKNRA